MGASVHRNSSPEHPLRRSYESKIPPSFWRPEQQEERYEDVRTGELGRMREIGEGGVDGAHRGLPKTAADT